MWGCVEVMRQSRLWTLHSTLIHLDQLISQEIQCTLSLEIKTELCLPSSIREFYKDDLSNTGLFSTSLDVFQMTPYCLYSALLFTVAHRGLVKSSALYREQGAIWGADSGCPCCRSALMRSATSTSPLPPWPEQPPLLVPVQFNLFSMS